MNIPDGAKVGLIGLIFDANNIETPWLVQDNRKALKNEHPCGPKPTCWTRLPKSWTT